MSETPRTDAIGEIRIYGSAHAGASEAAVKVAVLFALARQLERELQQAIKERDEARQHIENVHSKDFGFP